MKSSTSSNNQLRLDLTQFSIEGPFKIHVRRTQFVIKDRRGKTLCAITKPNPYVWPAETKCQREAREANTMKTTKRQLEIATFIMEKLNS